MASATGVESSHQASAATSHVFKAGTRKSKLALAQAEIAANAIREAWPQHEVEIHGYNTVAGDVDKVTPFKDMPVKNLWTHELERMLVEKELDLLVHSLKEGKDVPTEMAPTCCLGAILSRPDPRDALVVKGGQSARTLAELPDGATIGTSSIRRTAQLALKYPRLRVIDCRGNIETRLRKLDAEDGQFDAIIIAAAGLIRVNLADRITQFLDSDNGGMLYAVGQGALGVEMRENDEKVKQLLAAIDQKPISLACLAERSLLRTLEGGCSAPLGVESTWDTIQDETLHMKAIVVSTDGKESTQFSDKRKVIDATAAEQFGVDIANGLIERGAGKILAEIKEKKKPTEVIEI
ncbi:MAG: hypothetical protein Q9160_000604 [Pyrenula sp. 1 TL-2023]